MRHRTFRADRLSRRGHGLLFATLVVACIWLASAGCATPTTRLTVTSIENRQTYRQGFTQAFARRDARGDLEVVMACGTPTASGELHPNLKQVMHIRVLWSPGPGLKTDQPAATNAAVSWYVFSDSPGRMDMVEYTGTALVEVDRDGDLTTIDIRNASLRPSLTAGRLRDPIGAARCEGTVVARTSRERVEEILSGVKVTLATARLSQGRADANGTGER